MSAASGVISTDNCGSLRSRIGRGGWGSSASGIISASRTCGDTVGGSVGGSVGSAVGFTAKEGNALTTLTTLA